MRQVLLTHTAIGDQFVVNAMVRHFYEKSDELCWFVHKNCAEMIQYMYSDLDWDRFRPHVVDTIDGKYLIAQAIEVWKNTRSSSLTVVGYGQDHGYFPRYFWTDAWYKSVGLSPDLMKKGYKNMRNRVREEEFFRSLNLPEKYALCQHDPSKNCGIVPKTDLPLVWCEPGKTNVFTDWLLVAERAEELHMYHGPLTCAVDIEGITTPIFMYETIDKITCEKRISTLR